jgi:hypothetical protein
VNLLALVLSVQAADGALADGALTSPASGELTPSEQELVERVKELEARLRAVESRNMPRAGASVEAALESGIHTGPLIVAIGERLEKAVAFGGPVDVSGDVVGDAVSVGSDVVVRSTGVVEGNAVAVGGNVVVEPGGHVAGDRVALGEPNAVTSVAGAFGDDSPKGMVRGVFRQLSVLSCLMGAGVLLMGLWPQNVERVARPLGDRPFWYGIAGAILTASFVVGSGLLAITLVGIPLAVLLSIVLAVAWLLGVVALCKAIGERFPVLERSGAWASFLAGAVILGAVSLLPYLGPLLIVLVGFPAVGAALLTRLGNRRVG